ncbi:hypothetical protein [Sinisalibacter aestuarii]|uniref:Uncharacterized protein n=1 Tax=Sinisalibacter aestuarii TaxID=2949426 RepID=A0ABQ5LT93_9RHOB|nr:hypothetical protein [Sinisalibacter aestuarii]GKY88216.1 hypothetical protein STA1M1_20850 [Sinisalibacter aestuarii]
MFRATFYALVLVAIANPGLADEVSDTLSSALQAYEDGDIEYAIEELDYAKQLLQEMTSQQLTGFLPEAPAGWTREISGDDMNAGLAIMGGGIGAEADYTDGTDSFTITIMADSPMISMFGGMLSNAGMLGMKMHRIGREKFIFNDGELTGLIDNRILIQAKGAEVEVMIPVLETIDFAGLEDFGG